MKEIVIYDVDGTITNENCDLWFSITEKIITNKEKFLDYINQWKAKKKHDPYKSSLLMMQQALSLTPKDFSRSDLKNIASQVCTDVIQNNNVRSEALSSINSHLSKGRQVVLSSTNYEEGVSLFLEKLFEFHLIPKCFSKKINCSGSTLTFSPMTLNHFNMGNGKVDSLENIFKMPLSEVKKITLAAYGDDPNGNDHGILNIAKNPYVVDTTKNKNETLPDSYERVFW